MRPVLLAVLLPCSALPIVAFSPVVSAAPCAPNIPPWADAGSGETVAVFSELLFDGSGGDDDGEIDLFEWDFEGDGIYDFSSDSTAVTSWTYTALDLYDATLRVTVAQVLSYAGSYGYRLGDST